MREGSVRFGDLRFDSGGGVGGWGVAGERTGQQARNQLKAPRPGDVPEFEM